MSTTMPPVEPRWRQAIPLLRPDAVVIALPALVLALQFAGLIGLGVKSWDMAWTIGWCAVALTCTGLIYLFLHAYYAAASIDNEGVHCDQWHRRQSMRWPDVRIVELRLFVSEKLRSSSAIVLRDASGRRMSLRLAPDGVTRLAPTFAARSSNAYIVDRLSPGVYRPLNAAADDDQLLLRLVGRERRWHRLRAAYWFIAAGLTVGLVTWMIQRAEGLGGWGRVLSVGMALLVPLTFVLRGRDAFQMAAEVEASITQHERPEWLRGENDDETGAASEAAEPED